MNLRVEHLGLAAPDPAALKEWYVRVLGAEVRFANGEQPPSYFLAFPGDDLLLEIYPAERELPEATNNVLAGWRHVALRVASLEAARAELEARGVSFTRPVQPAGGGGRVLFFADPEGNLIHFIERPTGTFPSQTSQP